MSETLNFSLSHLVRTAGNSDIVPTVRIKSNDPVEILQALDCGSLGVQVPMTYTREVLQRVVDSAKYAPMGNRGFSASPRAGAYGFMDAAEYARMANFIRTCLTFHATFLNRPEALTISTTGKGEGSCSRRPSRKCLE